MIVSALGQTRYRLGVARARMAESWRDRPPRLREPFFSPDRELSRIVERCRRAQADPAFTLQAFESHQPVFLGLLDAVPNARVLELGTGYGSTPIVLGRSESSLSLETDPRWQRRFDRYGSQAHRIELCEDFDEREWRARELCETWDVALVDNSPGTARQSNLQKLAPRTRFVVCHDTQECFLPSASRFGWDFSSFRYVWTCTRFATYTTIVSNHEPIPALSLPGIDGHPG